MKICLSEFCQRNVLWLQQKHLFYSLTTLAHETGFMLKSSACLIYWLASIIGRYWPIADILVLLYVFFDMCWYYIFFKARIMFGLVFFKWCYYVVCPSEGDPLFNKGPITPRSFAPGTAAPKAFSFTPPAFNWLLQPEVILMSGGTACLELKSWNYFNFYAYPKLLKSSCAAAKEQHPPGKLHHKKTRILMAMLSSSACQCDQPLTS